MFDKVEHALSELKGEQPKSGFNPYKEWIKKFVIIALSMTILFLGIKYAIENLFGRSTYLSIVNIDLIIILQIIIFSLLVEMRLHQVSIRSRL